VSVFLLCFFYKKRDQKKRAFRRRRAEVGFNRWGYESSRQQRAALVLLAALEVPMPGRFKVPVDSPTSRINHSRR